jgi:hypothetical protein
MEITLACLLILVVVFVYLHAIWQRFKKATDDEVVPDRWNGVHRDLAPKFYWFQIVRMLIVMGICLLSIAACIVGAIFGLLR